MDSSIKPNASFSQDVRTLAKAADKKESGPVGQQVSELAHEKKISDSIPVMNKKQLNASILESAIKFNETIAGQPQSLLLKTALQGINDALKEMGVETTAEDAYQSAIDFSPEATAERIVSFSTQFLGSYREQHPDMGEQESLTAFVDIISQGIDQGFGEARDILGGLKVLEGDIGDNISKTYELVQQGLHAFAFPSEKSKEAVSES
ncbi:DUF5610 domain-containing protein [Psychromonas antarctica]|uniref:DUF5610 domain-containing protein n=1 Tax=Psychromonas antarctica TaxID=67573 RepID=UPI001EE95AE5|nr:DUF5610 domain-containing protein [Psychromonas antarctica]MCG6201735.1 DUF5610 domain-containing protein [Psychromonas antarctica]